MPQRNFISKQSTAKIILPLLAVKNSSLLKRNNSEEEAANVETNIFGVVKAEDDVCY